MRALVRMLGIGLLLAGCGPRQSRGKAGGTALAADDPGGFEHVVEIGERPYLMVTAAAPVDHVGAVTMLEPASVDDLDSGVTLTLAARPKLAPAAGPAQVTLYAGATAVCSARVGAPHLIVRNVVSQDDLVEWEFADPPPPPPEPPPCAYGCEEDAGGGEGGDGDERGDGGDGGDGDDGDDGDDGGEAAEEVPEEAPAPPELQPWTQERIVKSVWAWATEPRRPLPGRPPVPRTALLVRELTPVSGACKGATWARSSALVAPRLLAVTPATPRLEAAALKQFAELPDLVDEEAPFTGGDGMDDHWRNDKPLRVLALADSAGAPAKWVVVLRHNWDMCEERGPRTIALWRVGGDRPTGGALLAHEDESDPATPLGGAELGVAMVRRDGELVLLVEQPDARIFWHVGHDSNSDTRLNLPVELPVVPDETCQIGD